MKFRRGTAVGALVIGAMTVGFGTAHAEPAAPAQPELKYSVMLEDAKQPGAPKTVVTRLGGGTFQLSKTEVAAKAGEQATQVDTVDVKDADGKTVVTLPLAYNVAGTQVQVKPEIKNDGKELALTPDKTVASDKQVEIQPVLTDGTRPVLKDVASPIENQRAMGEFSTQFGLATAVGGFVGTAVGVVVGGIVGCLLGLPFLGVGCIPAAIAGAGIGGILGTVAVGGPALALAGMDLVNTLQAAPGTSKWSDENMARQQQQQQGQN
ncbi:hypothetical protein [Nocardia transvalensis]|uniref:hypothetical protein n=1 Tax=Nocardia transvalensis TaxID=37333 RepID=UPI001893D43D|nr:hypothetical protein [Nocardia transvalensis]MBF6329023.1 hypothetical protein [Nocardia transvalensis]